MDKLNDVFKIIKDYIFEIDETNNDYLCIICKNILSNAHSGPCGCRYCHECISKFLNITETFCPGNTKECKEEKLNLNKNIQYEPSVNMKISKLIVKCPEKFCQFRDEIKNIENHIRVCNFQQINCPYANIGCKQPNLINDDMKNHLLIDIVPHSNLLLELIENMRNEMKLLKKDIVELKDENKSLKDEIETIKLDRKGNQTAICELEKKEKMNNDKIDVDNTIATMKRKAEHQTVDIDEIKIKLKMMENKQKEFMNKFDEISTGNAQLRRKLNEIDEMVNNSINNLQMEIRGEFEWRFDRFSELGRDKPIYSKPFFAFPNGYQMCLSISVGIDLFGYNNLYVYLHVMRGEFDDDLLWPCKCDVSIDVINQNNNQIFKSETIKYNNQSWNSAWNKPTSERNEGIWFLPDLPISDIKNLLKSDQLLIKCRTKIPE